MAEEKVPVLIDLEEIETAATEDFPEEAVHLGLEDKLFLLFIKITN